MNQERERKNNRNLISIKSVLMCMCLHLFIELKSHISSSNPCLVVTRHLECFSDIKHPSITTQSSMKHSLASWNKPLFQGARSSIIGARTSMMQNSFQRHSDAKISRCSNEHNRCSNEQMPKYQTEAFWPNLEALLERAKKCSTEHQVARSSGWSSGPKLLRFVSVVTLLLILC